MRRAGSALLAALLLASSAGSGLAMAFEAGDDVQEPDELAGRRWSLGLRASLGDSPQGHLGIPLQGTENGFHLAAAIVGRYQLNAWSALDAGMGLPSSAMGPAAWAGYEIFSRLLADPRGLVALELYTDPGLQLGFAGPDYYARRDNDFPGYDYAFGGDASLAVRLPVGLRLCWFHDRFDTFVEGTVILTLTPSAETLFDLAVGAQVRF